MDNLEKKSQKLKAKSEPVPESVVEFFCDWLRLVPFPYQAEFLEDTEPFKVLRWCRRAGKTTVMSGSDIHFAATHPNARVLVIMPKYTQTKEIYFQGEGGLHDHLARMPRDKYNAIILQQLQTIIRFHNGAAILAEVPEPFTIRGHGPSKISIDEFNFIRRDRDLWLSALLPMTLTKKVYINIASTPWNKDSVYWQMCFDKAFKYFSGNKFDQDPPREKPKYLLTWEKALQPDGPIKKSQVDIMKEQYAGEPWRWKREMECAFVDDETSFLPSSLIIKCQNELLEFARFEDDLEGAFFLGWDLGREIDPAAVAVVDLEKDVRRLVHCKQFPLKTPHVTVMAYIKSLCDRWDRVQAVYYDHTGTMGMDEQIERAGFPNVKGINFSKPSKHGMATGLKDLMMSPRDVDKTLRARDARRKFELPYDRDVQAELNVEQWEQMKGSEVYTFSHPQGTHDDRFWAICLAVLGTLEAEPGPRPDVFIFG